MPRHYRKHLVPANWLAPITRISSALSTEAITMIDAKGAAAQVLQIISQMHRLEQPYVVPSEHALAHVFEQVFWSSVNHYEGLLLTARVFFAPRAALTTSSGMIAFDTRLAVSQESIRRFSPAHGDDGGLLVVEDSEKGIAIEGILGSSPFSRGSSPHWLCVESRAPGTIRVGSGRLPLLEFTHGSVKQLGGMSFDRTFAEVLLIGAAVFPAEPAGYNWHVASALVDIVFDIEARGKGGAIWILPSSRSSASEVEGSGHRVLMADGWWEPYREMWEDRTSTIRLLNPGCQQGHEFLQTAAQEWDGARKRSLTRSIASLAGTDGAILMDGSPRVLGFGVVYNKFSRPATSVLRTSDPSCPLEGTVVDAAEFGGSRHRSAIDFCSSNHPAVSLVASHDGGVTAFASLAPGKVIGNQVSLIPSHAGVKPP